MFHLIIKQIFRKLYIECTKNNKIVYKNNYIKFFVFFSS